MAYKRLRKIYILLVQVDYLTGLSVAYLLGSGQWLRFGILLVVSLILGCLTVLTYTSMMEGMYQENGGPNGKDS